MLNIEPLSKHHDRTTFDCANEALNNFLRQYANQHHKKGLSKTYVLIDDRNPSQILGFYTLSAYALDKGFSIDGLPKSMKIPSVLIGKLAIDKNMQGKKFSHFLMAHAFQQISLSQKIGIALILVDLKGYHLIKFYEYFGFKQIQPQSLTMYLKLGDIATVN